MSAEASDTPKPAADGELPPAHEIRQAVLVIHGMGNQSPMTTLRSFVEAVWTSDPSRLVTGQNVWSKRDSLADDMELRRIVAGPDGQGIKADFFEFYWAHLMEGTRLSSVIDWLKRLFGRWPGRVPPAVKPPWWLGGVCLAMLFFLLCAVAWLLFLAVRMSPEHYGRAFGPLVAAILVVAGLYWLRRRILMAVVGDAARYLTPDPPNIAARAEIRRRGKQLLEKLHHQENGRSKYDRVIIVGHSLGAVIGYDIINFYWNSVSDQFDCGPWEPTKLFAIEQAAKALLDSPDDPEKRAAYRNAQRAFSRLLAETSKGKWLISDFVTLGSPLTHAHFLMVDDGAKTYQSDDDAVKATWIARWRGRLDDTTAAVARVFLARVAQREFPVCPPVTEPHDRFFYPRRRPTAAPGSVPHGGAPFAAVRWTNIYAPRRLILWGDVIGGPAAPLFGPGIQDVALTGVVAESFIAHTKYWQLPQEGPVGASEHLTALRAAVNLADGAAPAGRSGAAGPATSPSAASRREPGRSSG